MKKVSFFFTLFMFQLVFSQTNINFENSDFAAILSKAKAEKKLIFLDAYASWCGPCKMMERNVFTNGSVADYYNKNFINARIDMEKGEGKNIASKYAVRSYPTLMFLNSDGDVVGQELGYMDKDVFLEFGKKYNNPKLVNQSLKEDFLKGTLDQASLLTFITIYTKKDPILAKQASEKYFSNKKDNVFSVEEINALLNSIQSADDANYAILKNNKSGIVQIFPENNYQQFDNYIRLKQIFTSATDEKTKTIDDTEILKQAENLLPKTELEKNLSLYKLNYYISNENYPAYEQTALAYYKNPNDYNNAELLAVAGIFIDEVKNPKSLQTAATWAEKVVMSQENYDSTSTLAQLYDLLGKKDEARMYAGMAINFAKEENRDADKLTKILNKQ